MIEEFLIQWALPGWVANVSWNPLTGLFHACILRHSTDTCQNFFMAYKAATTPSQAVSELAAAMDVFSHREAA